MALAVDGFSVLRAIGKNAEMFEPISSDINKQAASLLEKQIKKADLERIRAIYSVVGSDDFRKVVDLIKALGPVLKRIDAHNPDHKTKSALEQRVRINALAAATAQPFEKPVKVKTPLRPRSTKKSSESTKNKRERRPKQSPIMGSLSLRVRERKEK